MAVTREQRISVGIAAGVVVLASVAHVINPSHDTWLPKCPFHVMTHLWCPGCGATRAACALAQGNLSGAFRHNVLFVPVLLVLAWAWAVYALCAFFPELRTRTWAAPPFRRWHKVIRLIPVVIAAFWVVRNIPGAPVHFLST